MWKTGETLQWVVGEKKRRQECVGHAASGRRFLQQVSWMSPWEDQCEWQRMTINRMAGPDCAVMGNLINTHTCIILSP